MNPRILIADDHLIVRMGLVTLLKNCPSFDVVGEAEDGEEAVRKALSLRPDVVLMDLRMPGKDGVQATEEIRAAAPEVKVLVLTTYSVTDEISRVLSAGAAGVILKNSPRKALVEAIQAVARGESVISDDVRELLAEDPPAPVLTPRQEEILRSATLGLTNADIARQLDISPTAVKQHLSVVFAKLGAANRAEAIAIAIRKQLFKT